jgi:hypothetical protein
LTKQGTRQQPLDDAIDILFLRLSGVERGEKHGEPGVVEVKGIKIQPLHTHTQMKRINITVITLQLGDILYVFVNVFINVIVIVNVLRNKFILIIFLIIIGAYGSLLKTQETN